MIKASLHLKYEHVSGSDGSGKEMVLYVDGVAQKRLGSGRDRVVYAVEGTSLVAKVDDDQANQAGNEWKAYRRISKTTHREHVARLYKPVNVIVEHHPHLETAKVTFQERVVGECMCMVDHKHEAHAKYDEIRRLFENEFATNDLHGNNVMYDHEKKKVLIVDLGL